VALRTRGASLLLRPRSAAVAAVCAVVALAAGTVALGVGDYPVPLGDVPAALTGRAGPVPAHVVTEMRLPRVATGLGAGAAFGVSGAVFQRVLRNPLVSPDVIGVNAGASAGAVLVITLAGGATAPTVAGALAGAAAATLLGYLVARRDGISGYRLVLVGIGVTALATALTSVLLTRAELHDVQRASIWLTGSLANRGWAHAAAVAAALVLLAPLLAALGRRLRLLELGDDLARSLGAAPEPARAGLLAAAVVLAAVGTAVAGPVAFVALVAPQIVRRLVADRTAGLAASGACGALLVVAADLAARLVFAPVELPVGVLTAVFGAPFLLALLVRAHRGGRAG
jgi:iron complex transport system permease protein